MVDRAHTIYTKLKESSVADVIMPGIEKFLDERYPATKMHDPLTLSSVISPFFLEFEQKKVAMNEDGVMSLSDSGKSTILSCEAQYEGFMKFLESRL